MNPVLLAALQLARRLRHCSVREEHLFLAALETPEARLAVPVDLAAIESAVRSAVDVQMGVDTYSDPSLHLVDGRALGLALASGLADAAAEHVVVASLWEPQGACALILEGTGGSRPEVLGRLGRLGELAPSTVRVNPLVRPAFDAAAGAGDDFVGDHHILMSVLDGRPDARAKGFMAGIAVDAAGFVRWYEGERRGWGPAPVRSFEGEPAPSAACFELFGRAEGWAAPGEIGSAEALVAYLWRPSGANLGWLGPPGLTPRELEARLKSSGLPAPAAPMPVPTVGPEMLRFTFPAAALQPVLVALGARFPGGGWDVNWDDERGWVDAIPGLGADAVIEEVLSAGSGG